MNSSRRSIPCLAVLAAGLLLIACSDQSPDATAPRPWQPAAAINAQAIVQLVQVDQFQLNGAEQNQAIHSSRPVGQTFTVGQSGLLNSIELSLFGVGFGGDLFVEILDMSGGDLATAPTLGTVTVPEGTLGRSPTILALSSVTATLVDLSPLQLNVNSSDKLAFRLTTPRCDGPTSISTKGPSLGFAHGQARLRTGLKNSLA